MSDAQLEAKFHGLTDPVLGASQSSALLQAAWAVGSASDASALVALARP